MDDALTLEYQDALVFVKHNGIECDTMAAPSPECDIVSMGLRMGLPPVAVILGSSYFQRIARTDSLIQKTIKSCNAVKDGTMTWGINPERMMDMGFRSTVAIYATCMVIATKVTGPRYSRLLTTMLKRTGLKLTTSLIVDLELECIVKLGWRLMPLSILSSSSPATKKRLREESLAN